jgi:O-antigen/teichoic acid export membrane protein
MSAVPSSPETVPPDDTSPQPTTDGRLVSSRGLLVSASMFLVSVLSYGGTLLLAHLLDPASYSVYAAAATMLGTVGVFSAALIPLPLTVVIRNHPSRSEERRRGVTFAWTVSAAAGLLSAVITGLTAALFAPPTVVAAVAVSALVLFLCSPMWGWLHGDLLFVRKAVMIVAEVCVRVLVSAGVVLLGWGAGGALTGFMAGSAVVLLTAPRGLRRDLAWRPGVLRDRARWVETGDLALAQLIVSALVGADVVLVAVLAVHGIESAGYQALSTLAKAPVFVAGGAVSVAFPLLRSRQADTSDILTATLRSFAVLALSSAAVIATAPPELVLLVFPGRYAASLTLLPVLAAAGAGYAALTMLTTVMLGLRAYRRCQVGLLAAAVLLPSGMLLGWRIDGVPGLAVGAAVGAVSAAGVLWVVAAPLLPAQTPRRALGALLVAGALVGLLALAGHVPVLWICCVLVLGGAVLRLSSRGPKSPTSGSR